MLSVRKVALVALFAEPVCFEEPARSFLLQQQEATSAAILLRSSSALLWRCDCLRGDGLPDSTALLWRSDRVLLRRSGLRRWLRLLRLLLRMRRRVLRRQLCKSELRGRRTELRLLPMHREHLRMKGELLSLLLLLLLSE